MSIKTTLAAVLIVIATMTGVVQAKSPAELNDLEIAHAAYTAGSIDIRYAHLALALSRDPEVRKFAKTMIRDHTAVNEQALALVKKLGITPKDNDVSRNLVKRSEALIAELRALDGAAFDARYASNELEYHRFVNGAVERIFIPNAKNADLKALLASALKVFKVHEGHAEKMAKIVN
ncbi:MAG: DUF4142 domain-containing protein [Hyphomicrobiaceae bacterium]